MAFLGSIESGLAVTTINPWYTSEEMSRQFISCQPKAVFCLVDNFDVVKKACTLAEQPNIKIVAIKLDSTNQLRDDMISFDELINTAG